MAVGADAVRQLVELATGITATPADTPEPAVPLLQRARPDAGAVPEWRPLTIGIATHDDFDGAWFTIQAIRMYHPEVRDEVAFLLLDNDPDGPGAWELKTLEHKVDGFRYLPRDDVRGTAVRDLLFREANSEWVLCLDSHVLLAPGSLRRLLDWCAAHPGSRDLVQGPILWDELGGFASPGMDAQWRGGMYGTWAKATHDLDVDADPIDIDLHGLGLFACRKDAWPGFNPRFRGFGGEEGYLHEKIRARGGRTLCLPFLQWLHRFARPRGTTYRNAWEDRIRNYLVGWDELGLDTDVVVEHFTEHLGAEVVDQVVARLAAEQASPWWRFDAIYCVEDNDVARVASLDRRLEQLGIADRAARIAAPLVDLARDDAYAEARAEAVAHARVRGLDSVAVVDDGALLDDTVDAVLARVAASVGTTTDGLLVVELRVSDVPEPSAPESPVPEAVLGELGALAGGRPRPTAPCVDCLDPDDMVVPDADPRPVLVTGVPRSGTTWVGRTFGNTWRAVYLHEPDNSAHGVFAHAAKRGRGRYPRLRPGMRAPALERCYEAAFSGPAAPVSARATRAGRFLATVPPVERERALDPADGSVSPRLAIAHALAEPRVPANDSWPRVVKSVHTALLLEWLVDRFDLRLLVVRRHPMDIVASWVELGVAAFLHDDDQHVAHAAPDVVTTHGVAPPASDSASVERVAWLVGLLVSELDAAARRVGAEVVDHETLCRDPVGELSYAAGLVGLRWTAATTAFVEESDQPGSGERTQRVAALMPGGWRERLDEASRDRAAAVLARFPLVDRHPELRDHHSERP